MFNSFSSPTIARGRQCIFSSLAVYVMLRALCCIAASALVFATSALATEPDLPSRTGRVALIEGDVSFLSDTLEGWQRARLNFPVTSKNSLWLNGPGHAEVRIGAATWRVNDETVLDFVRIDDTNIRAFLQRGSLNMRLRAEPGAVVGTADNREGISVETPEGSVILEGNGRYRIDANADRGDTRIVVFSGRARFDNGGNLLTIDAGKALAVRHSSGNLSFMFESASESPFDRWASARDQQWDDTHTRVVQTRVISTYMTGYEELDTHGIWQDDVEYGRVWAPRVVIAGWAPYRYGSWRHVQPWGWTWVDDTPWGFAPFHYGRWVVRLGRWWWVPGAYSHRPVYAPALVAWLGSPRAGVTIGIGAGVGWFPLAPREYYLPPYTTNLVYVRSINNVTNNITVVNPPRTFANFTAGRTTVNQSVLLRGEPVRGSGGPTAGGNRRAHDPRFVQPIVAGAPMMRAPMGPAPINRGEPIAPRMVAPIIATPKPMRSPEPSPGAPRVSQGGEPAQSATPRFLQSPTQQSSTDSNAPMPRYGGQTNSQFVRPAEPGNGRAPVPGGNQPTASPRVSGEPVHGDAIRENRRGSRNDTNLRSPSAPGVSPHPNAHPEVCERRAPAERADHQPKPAPENTPGSGKPN